MKFRFLLVLLILPLLSSSKIDFEQYFRNQSMRFDFLLGGNSIEEKVYPEQIKKEPFWGGSKTNLTDPFNYGNYKFRVFDEKSGTPFYITRISTL